MAKEVFEKQQHYTAGGIDVIDFTKAKLSTSQYYGSLIFNVMKYLGRHQHRGGLSDLKKAQVYLKWAIETVEKNGEKKCFA